MLPIAQFRQEIVSTIEHSQVLVLSGETGWYALYSREFLYPLNEYLSSVASPHNCLHLYWKISYLRGSIAKSTVLNLVVYLLFLWRNEFPVN
jgi:hypothetical protein